MKPNILFIHTDEQRADSLGAYSSWAKTPYLNQIAKEGTVFTANFCQSPVCMPSRSSTFSCKPVLEVGCLNNHPLHTTPFPEGTITFPEVFADNGYATGSFGKHHVLQSKIWQTSKGVSACYPCMTHFELDPPHDEKEHKLLFRKTSLPLISAGIFPDNQTDCAKFCVEHGMEFLENVPEGQPWLLRLSIEWPHTPVLCPRPFDQLYKKGLFKIKKHSEEGKASRSKQDKRVAKYQNFDAFTAEELEWIYQCYYGLCAYVDSQIGRMIEYLKKNDLYDNTIIVFGSDHGRMLGEWGAGEKDVYDAPSWQTPLIMKYAPLIPKGARRDDFSENIDIGSTLLSLCGLKDQTPTDYRGVDLFAGDTGRHAIFGAIKAAHLEDKPDTFRYAIRTKKWRCDVDFDIYGKEMDFEQYDGSLYDLVNDPDEEFNLFYKPEYREVAQDLVKQLFAEYHATKIDPRLLDPEYFRFHRTWSEVCNMKIPKRKFN